MSLSSGIYLKRQQSQKILKRFSGPESGGLEGSKLNQGGYSGTGDYRTDDVPGTALTSSTCFKRCILLSEIHPLKWHCQFFLPQAFDFSDD